MEKERFKNLTDLGMEGKVDNITSGNFSSVRKKVRLSHIQQIRFGAHILIIVKTEGHACHLILCAILYQALVMLKAVEMAIYGSNSFSHFEVPLALLD